MPTSFAPAARLLIIEEDEGIRSLLLTLLPQEHYSCVAAASVEEALARLAEQRFDLILTELLEARPRDLFRAATRVQHLAAPTPLAVMTGWQVSPEEAASRGFVGLLNKPFDVDHLLAWLGKLVRQFASPQAACVTERAEIGP